MKRTRKYWLIVLACLLIPVPCFSVDRSPAGSGELPFTFGKRVEGITVGQPARPNAKWLQRLRTVYALEKAAKAQYAFDRQRFGVTIPYTVVMPQKDSHIAQLDGLFKAYGEEPGTEMVPLKRSKTLGRAFLRAARLESAMISQYSWLLKNAPDAQTKNVLNIVLLQTRMHYAWFTHMLDVNAFLTGSWW